MANYDVESHKHPWYRIMFFFSFLAPYARTTRYEETFFSLENREKKRLASLVRLMTIFIQIISEHNLKKKMATKAVLIEGLFV